MGAIESVWKGAGWRGFYRGVSASTVRAILVASSRLVAYEQEVTAHVRVVVPKGKDMDLSYNVRDNTHWDNWPKNLANKL